MTNGIDINKLVSIYTRRLQKLKEKEAFYGLETPVSVLTEIEDIKSKIEQLQSRLKGQPAYNIGNPRLERNNISFYQLPPLPGDFTGRENELAELLLAASRRKYRVFGVYGMGGLGKTTLAIKLAETLSSDYPDAQLYLDLKGVSDQHPLLPKDAMIRIVEILDSSIKIAKEINIDVLKGIYLSVLSNRRILLLMDNARDSKQVEMLIPPASCMMIVTSRQHFLLPGMYMKGLEVMAAAEAHSFVNAITPRIGDYSEELISLCGSLPLALRVAASLLRERVNLSPPELIQRLQDKNRRLMLTGTQAALQLSYDLLMPELQEKWREVAVFPDKFRIEAVAELWGLEIDSTKDVLGSLICYSLVEYNEDEESYRLHDLARLFARQYLEEDLSSSRERQATYFLNVIHAASKLSWISKAELINEEKHNLNKGQAWAAGEAKSNQIAARLCFDYMYLIEMGAFKLPGSHNWIMDGVAAAYATPKRINIIRLLTKMSEELLSRLSRERHLDINIDGALQGCDVFADEQHLNLIFRNLFNNSLRKTETRAVDLMLTNGESMTEQVSIVKAGETPDSISLIWQDNGAGMSSEIRDKLYKERCTDSVSRLGFGGIIISRLLTLNRGGIRILGSSQSGTEIGTIQLINLPKYKRNS